MIKKAVVVHISLTGRKIISSRFIINSVREFPAPSFLFLKQQQ